MDPNKKFDDYLKGLFDGNPEVPQELEWDAMNFDLTELTAPEEAPKPKKEYRKYLTLLLLLLLSFTTGYLLHKHYSNDNNIADDAKELVPIQKTNDLKNEPTQKDQISKNSTTDNITNTTTEQTTATTADLSIKSTTPSSTESRPYTDNQSTTTDITSNDNNTSTTAPSMVSNHSEEIKIKTEGKTNKTSTSLSMLPLKTEILTASNSTLADGMKELVLPTFSLIDRNPIVHKTRLTNIVVGYGLNIFTLSTTSANDLDDKLSPALGHSFKAGLRFNIMKNWTSNIMIRFDQYHTTYEHTQELETVYDIENSKKITRSEVIFHNNYTNTFGLQFGLGKTFPLTRRLSLQTSFHLAPIYTTKATGRTLIDESTMPLVFDSQINRLSLEGGFNAGVQYSIAPAISLELGYQFNNTILGETFINNGVRGTQRSMVSLMVSYRLKN